MRKLKYSFVIIFLSFAMPAFSQSKPGIADTCDILKLWDGSKIYCQVKSLSDVAVNYVSCTDSAKKPTFIVRTKVHYWIHPDNSYIVISYDSVITPPGLTALPESIIKKDTTDKGPSIKHKLFVNCGVGLNTVGIRLYGLFTPAGGGSGTLGFTYNGTVDYGTYRNLTVGLGFSYEEINGEPLASVESERNFEYLTRFNCGVRVLRYYVHTNYCYVYTGFRIGLSYWRDIPYDINAPSKSDANTTLEDKSLFPSFQALAGIKLIYRVIGLHLEVGIGTPYFAEAGLSIKI
jgi:hypothetical protein